MPEGFYDAALTRAARRFRDALSERDRAEVDRLIAFIEFDPSVDGRYIFLFDSGNPTYTVYDNNTWRIAFRIVENWTIEIAAISRVDPRQRDLHLRL